VATGVSGMSGVGSSSHWGEKKTGRRRRKERGTPVAGLQSHFFYSGSPQQRSHNYECVDEICSSGRRRKAGGPRAGERGVGGGQVLGVPHCGTPRKVLGRPDEAES
jgi:hypothetical protein